MERKIGEKMEKGDDNNCDNNDLHSITIMWLFITPAMSMLVPVDHASCATRTTRTTSSCLKQILLDQVTMSS